MEDIKNEIDNLDFEGSKYPVKVKDVAKVLFIMCSYSHSLDEGDMLKALSNASIAESLDDFLCLAHKCGIYDKTTLDVIDTMRFRLAAKSLFL